MFKIDDRIREVSTTQGAGTYTLGGAVAGYRAFSVIGANNYTRYFATDGVNSEWGIGRYLAGPDRLERTHIHGSTNGGAAVNWGVGTRTLRCGPVSAMDAPRLLSKGVGGGAGTTVLTQDEQRRTILAFDGALTGNRTIEVDSTVWTWVVWNNTSGAFSLEFKVTGGAGVFIPQGRRVIVFCDGGEIRKASVQTTGNDSEFASGTAMIFRQTSAPVGWTKQTTHNDKALRIVSGTVGSGGATGFTSVFGAGKVTGGKTLAISEIPAHTHGYRDPLGGGETDAQGGVVSTNPNATTGSTGGGGSHDHTLSLDLLYVDVIEATKD